MLHVQREWKGVAMSAARRRQMVRAHARYAAYCSCGRVVHGNGGKAIHRLMHERNGDGHHALIRDEWIKRFSVAPDTFRT